MGNRMEVNRLLRELKRVELQISLLRDWKGLSSQEVPAPVIAGAGHIEHSEVATW